MRDGNVCIAVRNCVCEVGRECVGGRSECVDGWWGRGYVNVCECWCCRYVCRWVKTVDVNVSVCG